MQTEGNEENSFHTLASKLHELEVLRKQQATAKNELTYFGAIIKYSTHETDPLVDTQMNEEINPYIIQSTPKISMQCKKVEKYLKDEEKVKEKPEIGPPLTYLVVGDRGQKQFWVGIESKLKEQLRDEYIQFALTSMKKYLQLAIICTNKMNKTLSYEAKLRWNNILRDCSIASKTDFNYLWNDPVIRNTSEFLKYYQPDNECFSYLFENINVILSENFFPGEAEYSIFMKLNKQVREIFWKDANSDFTCRIIGIDRVVGNIPSLLSYFSNQDFLVYFAEFNTVEQTQLVFQNFRKYLKRAKTKLAVFVVGKGIKVLETLLRTKNDLPNYNTAEPLHKYLEAEFKKLIRNNSIQFFLLPNTKNVLDKIINKTNTLLTSMEGQTKERGLYELT